MAENNGFGLVLDTERASQIMKNNGLVIETKTEINPEDTKDRFLVLKKVFTTFLVIFALIAMTELSVGHKDNVQTNNNNSPENRSRKTGENPSHPSIHRLAIVRPFGVSSAASLLQTFSDWNDFLPCDIDAAEENSIEIDIFLSFSQTYDSSASATRSVEATIEKFKTDRKADKASWARCFGNIHAIEANIPAEVDLYLPSQASRNVMWVNGPNRQFGATVRSITGGDFGQYDAMFVMEGDCMPVKKYWLDSLLEEAEDSFLAHGPFAILGSKYDGDSWDRFRDSLPLSLQHHINGNAVYNVSHPLFRNLLGQLESESGTPYNAVPYDYRMSQIMVEGMLGILPELPPLVVEDYLSKTGQEIPLNTEKFREWWEMFGGDERSPVRESHVIANYAGTNLSPRHLVNETASIIHGAKHHLPWDKSKHEITLVVSDWEEKLSVNLISKIDSSNHPFSAVVVMVPENMPEFDIDYLAHIDTFLNVTIERRSRQDYMDLCTAPIDTEWFMMTNAYHVVAPHVELLFTDDKEYRPVIPFTPADQHHCANFRRCHEIHESSQQFAPENSMVVQDFDMLFRTEERDAFCVEWVRRYGMEGEMLHTSKASASKEGPLGPTATSFVSYLLMMERADDLYFFSDSTLFGARDNFIREYSEEEESAAASGVSVLSGRLLRDEDSEDIATRVLEESNRRIQAPSALFVPVPSPSPLSTNGLIQDGSINQINIPPPPAPSQAMHEMRPLPASEGHEEILELSGELLADYNEMDGAAVDPTPSSSSNYDKYRPIRPPASFTSEDFTSQAELQFCCYCLVPLLSSLLSLLMI